MATHEHPASTPAVRALTLLGSLRRGSLNGGLLDLVEQVASPRVTVDRFAELGRIPSFDEDAEHAAAEVVGELRRRIERADCVIVVTPEYNASLPGHLKSAIDWASRPRAGAALRGKPAVVLGASPTPGGARHAIADAVRVLSRSGADVHEHTFSVPFAARALTSPGLADELRAFLASALPSRPSAGSPGR